MMWVGGMESLEGVPYRPRPQLNFCEFSILGGGMKQKELVHDMG